MGRKFGEFGESSEIHQTKTFKVAVAINNSLADLFFCQTFSTKRLKRVNSPYILPAKLSCYTVYPQSRRHAAPKGD